MVVCKNCGSRSPEGTLYCPDCRTRIAPYTEEEAKAYVASLQSETGSASVDTQGHVPENARRTGRVIVASIVGAILLLVAVVPLVAPDDVSQPAATLPSRPSSTTGVPVGSISSVDLNAAYEANEVAADIKYKGETLRITGEILRIGKDIMSTPYIVLEGDVQCMFPDRDWQVARMSIGDVVTLTGEIDGALFMSVLVRDCSV
jgi:hypothetical protein